VVAVWLYVSSGNSIDTLVKWAIVPLIFAFIWNMLPSIGSRPGSSRGQCINNLKQIQLALLNYEAANGKLPPPYLADANGKPMHSWRVLILPYMEEAVLYKQYKFGEPWDGPNNRKLAARMPSTFRCPTESADATRLSTHTSYFAVAGPETAWPTIATSKTSQFRDGTATTIMLVEASAQNVHWMDPRDIDINEAVKLLTTSRRTGHWRASDGFLTTTYAENAYRNVTFADGHCEWLGPLQSASLAKALLTVSGGEKIPENWEYFGGDASYTTVIKWGKVWSLMLFVILSLIPVAWLRRRGKLRESTLTTMVDA
jgi:prepilin-type processing-associated H-X9-DG protein